MLEESTRGVGEVGAPSSSQSATAEQTEPAWIKSPVLPQIRFGSFFEMHPIVFPAGAAIVLALVALTFVAPTDAVRGVFNGLRDWIGGQFGWLYVVAMNGFLVFAAWLGLGRYGHVKLSQDHEEPEFGRPTWFAMLFSAGMGIGLVFFAVSEPISHYLQPPPGSGGIGEVRSRLAMATTIFHWGLHPWGLYAVVALALAYFGFRRGMPLSFRSLLFPVIGDRAWGRTGDLIDTLTIIATLIGVATSLGIGAQQVNAGLTFLFGIPIGTGVQIALIGAITGVATVSVVLGLGTGIRRLSELNICLAAVLLVLVVLGFGLTSFFGAMVENVGAYLQVLPFNSFRTGTFTDEGRSWLNGWTVFYWAWWISWCPFVGMFIARVSRGRTLREFIVGVLLVPTIIGIAWLTAFGTTTLRQHTRHVELQEDEPDYVAANVLPNYTVAMIGEDKQPLKSPDGIYLTEKQPLTAVEYMNATIVSEDGKDTIDQLPTVLFVMLEGLFTWPALTVLCAGIATTCIILFFVTSSDSASMVIDIIASGGNPDPPVGTRLFWAVTEGLVAAALLFAGGLEALQAASITAALPLTFILIVACYALVRALNDEIPAKEL